MKVKLVPAPYSDSKTLAHLYVNGTSFGVVRKHARKDLVADRYSGERPDWKTPEQWAINVLRGKIDKLRSQLTPLEEQLAAMVQPELFQEEA